MIIAITGGSGFIGKLLVERCLKKGYEVRLLSRKNLPQNKQYNCFKGDLTNPKVDLSRFLDGVDILYHCAGEIVNKSLMQELHINGTKNLIKKAKGNVKRWIQLSSVGAYGKSRSGIITEKSNEDPLGVYEVTKTESDNLVIESGIPFSILRPSNVFGSSMPNQSIYMLFAMVKKRLFFYIGKKGVLLNYVHVDDVVEALVCCGENKNAIGEIFNISQSITIENLISVLKIEFNIQRKIIRLPEWFVRSFTYIFKIIPIFPLSSSKIDALTGRCIFNSSKIQRMLDFNFKLSLKDHFKSFLNENKNYF